MWLGFVEAIFKGREGNASAVRRLNVRRLSGNYFEPWFSCSSLPVTVFPISCILLPNIINKFSNSR